MTATDQPQMMPLRVTRNDQIADGIHLLEFRDSGGNPLPQFSAGAHITVRVPNGMLRKYSLCNDPAERDRLFGDLWNGMNTALVSGNHDQALLHLNASAKAKYGPVFTALRPHFAEIVASYSPLRQVEFSSDIGEYAVTRMVEGQKRLYLIYFLKDGDGVWRLDAM